jgi:RNA polymerase sigma factor (sigma-70 family)
MPAEKINPIPLSLIIKESVTGNARMQQLLYEQFALSMYAVCFRYVKNRADADDVMQDGFIKAFKNLDKYKGEGFFEGWLRKIMIRSALTHLRKVKKYSCHTGLEVEIADQGYTVIDRLSEKEIANLVTKLPPAVKTIFQLHVIEGFNHREIASILGCNECTSKSQYYRYRIKIRKILEHRA